MNSNEDNGNGREKIRVEFRRVDNDLSMKRLIYHLYTMTGCCLHPVDNNYMGNGESRDVYYIWPGKYIASVENIDRHGNHYCGWMILRVSHHEVMGEGHYTCIVELPLSCKPVWMPAPCSHCWDDAQEYIHWETGKQEAMVG